MNEVITIPNDRHELISISQLRPYKNKGFIAKFARSSWLFVWNEWYKDNLESVKNGDFSIFKGKNGIPRYSIFRHGEKIGFALGRKADNGKRFLFIPKSKSIQKHHYVFNVDENYAPSNQSSLVFAT